MRHQHQKDEISTDVLRIELLTAYAAMVRHPPW